MNLSPTTQVKDLLSIELKPETLQQFINFWLNQNSDHMFIPYFSPDKN